MWTTLLLQIGVPVAAVVRLGVGRARRVPAWLRASALALGCIAALSLATPWLLVPGWVRYVLLVAWAAASVRGYRRLTHAATAAAPTGRGAAGLAIAESVVVLALWTVAAVAVDGRRVPAGDVLDVACPLSPGTFLVVNGGSRQVVNAHLATLGDDASRAPWRGQSYGVDLVEIDGVGRRADGLSSPNLRDYRIYGQLVMAPCAGTVVAAVDGRPDMTPGVRDPDRTQLAGNYVNVRCGADEILMAHLQPGSVRVRDGDDVAAGDLLGFVGNSGNSDEPHLHVSAQRRTDDQPPVGGNPVWLRIAGRFLVRNDRITCR